jgi:hypothetical protein
VTTARAQEIRTGLAWLHAADPVLAQVIDDHPDFDPDLFLRRLPALDLFGALVFQIIGQQISVIAATALFVRLTGHFGGRVPDAGELAAVDQGTLRGLGLSRRKAVTVLDLAQRFSDGRLSEIELRELPDQEVIRRLTEVKDRRVDRAGRASHRTAAARCHPHGRPGPAPLDQGALRPRSPPGPCRGGRPRPALEAVPEPRLEPAACRREIELIQL